MMCRDKDRGSYLKSQGHKLRSKTYILLCLGYNSIMHGLILRIIYRKCSSWHDNVLQLTTMLIAQRSRPQTWVKGQKQEYFAVSGL